MMDEVVFLNAHGVRITKTRATFPGNLDFPMGQIAAVRVEKGTNLWPLLGVLGACSLVLHAGVIGVIAIAAMTGPTPSDTGRAVFSSCICSSPIWIASALALLGFTVPTKWHLYVATSGLNRQAMMGPENIIVPTANALRAAIDARG